MCARRPPQATLASVKPALFIRRAVSLLTENLAVGTLLARSTWSGRSCASAGAPA